MSMRVAHVHEALPAVGDPEGGWNWASLAPSTKTRKRNWGAGQVMGRAGKCGRRGAIPQVCSGASGRRLLPRRQLLRRRLVLGPRERPTLFIYLLLTAEKKSFIKRKVHFQTRKRA